MKNLIVLFGVLVLLLSSAQSLLAQTDGTVIPLSDGAVFENAFDQLGNPYLLSNLDINSKKKIDGSGTSSVTATTNFCTAGYFKLYYENGSFFDGNTSAQTTMCELFTNLSGFIQSPLSVGGNTVFVNIYCGTYTGTLNVLATGTPFWLVPNNPFSSNPGIAESQVFKTISSGVDAFSNIPIGIYANLLPNTSYFHGSILVKSGTQWNLGLTTSTVSSDVDFYSVMLHEATHLLGFISLIGSNGGSVFGPTLNHYSTYDQFLFDYNSNPLISPSSTACPTSSVAFSSTVSAISSSTSGCITNSSNCTFAAKYFSSNVNNVKVYTPNCFESASSLSHFEDLCSAPGVFTASPACFTAAGNTNNDLYFTMSNASGTGTCFIKRYLKEEERFVLCDLGYSVNATYTSNAATASHTYNAGACSGKNIWGVNDGFNGSVYTITTTATSISIPTTNIAANDATTTVMLSCIEVVYGNATASVTGANLSVTPTTGYTGLVVIKYLPTNSTPQMGNNTYIFVYFVPTGCNSGGDCNKVQNGGFENLSFGNSCGPTIGAGNNFTTNPNYYSIPSCWESYQGSADLYTRNCTNTFFPTFNVGSNVQGVAFETYNGSPNDRFVGLTVSYPNLFQGPYTEALKNNLTTTLVPSQSYQLSMLVSNYSGTLDVSGVGITTVNPGAKPMVITLASAPVFAFPNVGNFPTGLNILTQFTVHATTSTVAPWTAYTHTFVFTPTVGHSAMIFGADVLQTYSLNGYFETSLLFVDEISLLPIPTPTFLIPNATACGNTSFTNLAQYATGTGTFTGASVSFTNPQYHFNSPPVLSPGNYPVTYSSSNGTCVNTVWQNILVSPFFTITPSITGTTCVYSPSAIAISAISSAPPTTYTWQPGNLIGNSVVVTPTVYTTYTVYASDLNNCTVSNTLSIPFATNCCASSFSVETSTTFTSTLTTISGPIAIVNSPTIQAGATLDLTGEITFPPNASITVESGGTLRIKEAHLYSCAAGLWQGIIVKNGGKITTAKEPPATIDNLIEDAVIAIDITGHTSSTVSLIAELSHTTFNKNYISINISNYQSTLTTYPFFIENCVFTSRDLPFNSTQWPQVGETSTLNTVGADLRTAINPTTDLSPPYLAQSGFTITNLKSPYASESSSIAIKLSNVGATSSGNYYGIQIGSGTSANSFNLFDAHRVGIHSTNSNVYSFNNVFQNSTSTGNGYIKPIVPGSGIYSEIIGGTGYDPLFNSLLDLNPNGNTNKSLGNRFWDCYFAVSTVNNFSLNAKYATVRSTHTITPNWFIQGSYGISAISNRFGGYAIANCDFNNILHPAGLVFKPGAFDIGAGTQNGIYVKKIDIYNNFMSPALSTVASQGTNWMVAGIKLNAPISGPVWQTTTSTGISIYDNEIDRSLQGILLVGTKHNFTKIYNNTISLVDNDQLNPGYNTWQPAIFIASSQSVSAYSNTLSSNTSTNIYVSLVHTGFSSSSNIYCNKTTGGWRGFLFEGPNNFTRWKGNLMQSQRWGLTLFAGGIIGPQGTAISPSDNQWLGSWSGGNYNTYVDIGSNAINSPLTTRTGTWIPTNNNGTVSPGQQYGVTGTLFTSTIGVYSCGTSTNPPELTIPSSDDYDSEELKYIADKALYDFLHENEDLRPGGSDLANFYDSLANSSIADFYAIEQLIYEGNITGAANINNDVSPTNTVEENYQEFYRLYIAYTNNNFNADDSTSLYNLAHLCPGINGACVYKARALYGLLYLRFEDYSQACDWTGARLANTGQPTGNSEKYFDIKIFPNPSTGFLNVKGKNESEILSITIRDITGRIILKQNLITKEFVGYLELNFVNGMYFITATNLNHEIVTKKITISR